MPAGALELATHGSLEVKSPPFPQLFPNLNKRLHLARARNATVNQSAVPVALLVKVPHGGQAKMRETLAQFREIFLAQHLRFSAVGAWGPGAGFICFVFSSPRSN